MPDPDSFRSTTRIFVGITQVVAISQRKALKESANAFVTLQQNDIWRNLAEARKIAVGSIWDTNILLAAPISFH